MRARFCLFSASDAAKAKEGNKKVPAVAVATVAARCSRWYRLPRCRRRRRRLPRIMAPHPCCFPTAVHRLTWPMREEPPPFWYGGKDERKATKELVASRGRTKKQKQNKNAASSRDETQTALFSVD